LKAITGIFILLFLSSFLFGQKNYTLELILNNDSNDFEMPKYKIQFKDSLMRTKEVDRIVFYLQTNGYAELKIDSSIYYKYSLKIYIVQGQKYIWKKLDFNTSEWKMLQNLKQESLDFNNKDFNYDELLMLQRDIITRFENSGYPFASIKLSNIEIVNNGISAKLVIDKGSIIIIDTIKLTSFDGISHGFIQQYLGIKVGEEYNESKVKEIEKLINMLDFMEIDKPMRIDFSDGKAELLLSLRKKNNNQFNGIIGMAPNSQNKKLQFTGNLNLKLVNGFNRGERISLLWESPGNSSQFLEISLQYPYLFNSPFGAGLDFKIDKQDTTYVNLEYKPSLQFAIAGQDYISTYIHVFQSNYLNTEVSIDNNLKDVSSQSFGFGLHLNHLDNIINPRRGFFLKVNSDGGYKYFLSGDADNNEEVSEFVFRVKSESQVFIPLFRRQTIMLENYTAYIAGENIMINELYKIGGFKTFKGFDEQSIFAQFYSVYTAEYRLLLDQYSYLGAFYSIGQVVNPYPITSTGVYQSFGLTFNFATKAGVFGLSYALGKNEETNFEFGKAKIHFGYMAVF